ncbi:HNH endonuclease signature motif containing protein [Herbiconiux sp. L3-i23]|uniref:HNH endonuclease signature motif containing protein n=1 Tax=Herbiconiux sp. L3-i23 TaxID=2905871 RepID=UPI00204B7ECC|nr:HNH endonuclease signature motif containing protein [Herbiconiux sp. L3-i23]BDI22342.1 hypothetical protein L3i23_11180 [Herbiconiux sp. L3-i23]
MSQAHDEQPQQDSPHSCSGVEFVDALTAGRIVERGLAAERYAQIDGLRLWWETNHGASWSASDDLAWRDLRAEVAASLAVHERTAESLLGYARRLVHQLPSTLSRLSSATISDRHARIVVDQSLGVPAHLVGEYERRVLEQAETLPPSRFERFAAGVAASIEPSVMVEQHREAMTSRRVYAEAAPHGMAWLHLLLDAPDALGGLAAITGHARTLHRVPGETRTLSQIEADVARDLLVDSIGVAATPSGGAPVPTPAAQRGVKAEVYAHVPVLTAMGESDEPGTLGGYGPIDAQTARELAGTASSWIRLLTDPADGAVLDFGRDTYRVPAELRRYLQVRDEVCRFVGCTRAAKYCDLDHTVPWVEDGETIAANLANFCRGHHLVKSRGRWKIDNHGDGVIRCTSPTGKVYETRPAAILPRKSGVRFVDVDDEPDPGGTDRAPSTIREVLHRKFGRDDPAPPPPSALTGDVEPEATPPTPADGSAPF